MPLPAPGALVWTAVGVLSSWIAVKLNEGKINRFLMGVFRDVGRHKSYRRRFGDNSHALMSVVLHGEEDKIMLDLLEKTAQEEDEDHDVPTYTLDELWEYGNGADDSPLLISIFGRIYDVSAGEKFYGPGRSYGNFPGHDVTYALSTGCRTNECVQKKGDELTEKQVEEGKRWLSFFQLHDKYPYVGKLEGDHLEVLLDELVKNAIKDEGEELKAPILN
mmetsp:Transcript_11175/g.25893  ORF Transcript_11175/g.25893 Transcript_11175/m.25893 type:complete len:219 (-) Transcript_11175:584-1240(-)|eukprot:CAMPEP_0116845556 /NCGR_PEP_ID=MMETSP0418-20121206/13334_1 /TAXON_ID=1158023 /ORGANISM="Astrosyne radiata, Strain 13vi08-1A" /LENGTH=218 /DNA_ID=CAMNT_0004476683 /DNA_START=80 /DNA_END=736 /DNA_ORIENTATION=-